MDFFERAWRELSERPEGPMAFRFYLQPMMAILFAFRDGIRDAHAQRSAYLWAVFRDRRHRRELVRDGWRAIGRVFAFAVVMDLIYQAVVLRGFRPVQALTVAFLLAVVPYALLRGPINRVARHVHPPPVEARSRSRRRL